ncbi:TonB-dependent receptor [Agarivorans sp.]|uniref:TonB-dependent receptor n=1 Tax=Agarivorans sp. TaxID=1872412 RepID=UPI003D025817
MLLLGVVLSLGICAAKPTAAAELESSSVKPWAAVFLDYQHPDEPMLGISVAVNHYDKHYARWGYYLAYAKSQQQQLERPYAEQALRELGMLRLGLSYSISNDLSVYFGTSMLEESTDYTDGISLYCSECEAQWHNTRDKKWGADVGLRWAFSQHWALSLGYNSSVNGGIFSFGYRG